MSKTRSKREKGPNMKLQRTILKELVAAAAAEFGIMKTAYLLAEHLQEHYDKDPSFNENFFSPDISEQIRFGQRTAWKKIAEAVTLQQLEMKFQ